MESCTTRTVLLQVRRSSQSFQLYGGDMPGACSSPSGSCKLISFSSGVCTTILTLTERMSIFIFIEISLAREGKSTVYPSKSSVQSESRTWKPASWAWHRRLSCIALLDLREWKRCARTACDGTQLSPARCFAITFSTGCTRRLGPSPPCQACPQSTLR